MTKLFHSILIETRNVCNRKCWFCKFGQERRDGAVQQMEWETIRRILQNLKNLEYRGRISWYNINEPLSDRRMPEILKLTREHCPHAFLSLATNGDLLTKALYAKLKESGLDALGVSIYDDETLEAVEKIADRQMVLMDMRRPKPGMLENRGGNIRQERPDFQQDCSRFQHRSCERPFAMMVVNAEGEVVLCCADMYGDVAMGNVHEQSLEAIWNGERFAHYRAVLSARGRNELQLCNRCSYSGKGVRKFFPYRGARPRHRLRDRIRMKFEVYWKSGFDRFEFVRLRSRQG